jgi:hypothetical protein
MAEFEDEGLGFDSDDDDSVGDAPARDRSVTGGLSSQTQAIRNLQRARKALTNVDGAPEMTEYLMRSATVWAILELADAIRSTRQL